MGLPQVTWNEDTAAISQREACIANRHGDMDNGGAFSTKYENLPDGANQPCVSGVWNRPGCGSHCRIPSTEGFSQ